MKINLLLLYFLLSCTIGFAQFTLNTSNFSVSTDGGSSTISVGGNMVFNNSITNGNGLLVLSGTDQTISTSVIRSLSDVVIMGGGIKTFSGDFVISRTLSLQGGIISPSGTFVLGANVIIDEANSGSDISHIAGTLYREYNGVRMNYPVGSGTVYTPVAIETSTGTNPVLGITTISGVPAIDQLPNGVTDNSGTWSWTLNAINSDDFTTAQITLPFMAEDRILFGDDGYRPVVLYNESGQPTATLFNVDANASSIDNTVTAQDAGGIGTYLVGKELLFTPQINNIITPDGNSINDYLTIVNLSLYPENNVRIIDRYGVEVYYKDNYVSPLADAPPGEGEDFDFLAAGNYVCILNYKDIKSGETIKLRQGITVLR